MTFHQGDVPRDSPTETGVEVAARATLTGIQRVDIEPTRLGKVLKHGGLVLDRV